jgi:hypothetical protein
MGLRDILNKWVGPIAIYLEMGGVWVGVWNALTGLEDLNRRFEVECSCRLSIKHIYSGFNDFWL